MNLINQSIKVGLFFVFGIVMIWVVRETLQDSVFSQNPTYMIKAPFKDLKQLRVGDEVRLSGVKIGSVHQTHLENGQAIAILDIEDEYKIAKDSTATIAMSGLLGANYVGIVPGQSGQTLNEGESIETRESADITSVFNQVGNITKKIEAFLGGGEEDGERPMDSLFGNLNSVITENKTKISNALSHLEAVSNKLASGEGTLGKLINDEAAYNQLIAMTDDIKKAANDASAMITNIQAIAKKVEQGQGAFGVLLTDETVAQQIREVVQNVNEFSTKLNSDQSTLGRLIGSDELYQRASSTVNRVEDAVGGIENSGPLTAVGVAAGALF